MAKTAKLKANAKSRSIHSREARRATSPSLNIDKSLKNLPRPDDTSRPSGALSVHKHVGITKRKAKSKPQSRAQRLRLEKGLQRAEAVMDQMEKRVERSKGKGKTIRERSVSSMWSLLVPEASTDRKQANWEDVNARVRAGKTERKKDEVKAGEETEEVESNGIAQNEALGNEVDAPPEEVAIASALLVVDRTTLGPLEADVDEIT